MPKIKRVEDAKGFGSPLRVTERKGVKGKQAPSIRVKCGCCSEAVEIYYDDLVVDDPSESWLEINGVQGSVDQWKQVLLPFLGLEEVE